MTDIPRGQGGDGSPQLCRAVAPIMPGDEGSNYCSRPLGHDGEGSSREGRARVMEVWQKANVDIGGYGGNTVT